MTTDSVNLLSQTTQSIQKAFDAAPECDFPFRHWELSSMLPQELTDKILALRIQKTSGFKYDGTRASDSKLTPGGTPPKRLFITKEVCEQYPYFKDLVDALMSKEVLDIVASKYMVNLKDLYLRVEYINDYDGFFLEPHRDIIEKQLSLLLFLGDGPQHMGTDFYDKDLKVAKTAQFIHNHGYIFIQGDDTWHGLEPKEIPDRRSSLLINYVTFKTDWPVG